MIRVAMLWSWQRRPHRDPHRGMRSPPKVLSFRTPQRTPYTLLLFLLYSPSSELTFFFSLLSATPSIIPLAYSFCLSGVTFPSPYMSGWSCGQPYSVPAPNQPVTFISISIPKAEAPVLVLPLCRAPQGQCSVFYSGSLQLENSEFPFQHRPKFSKYPVCFL